jgi:hypothetical protein
MEFHPFQLPMRFIDYEKIYSKIMNVPGKLRGKVLVFRAMAESADATDLKPYFYAKPVEKVEFYP